MNSYELKNSTKARRVRITIFPGGRVVVTKPARVSIAAAERFAASKQKWIARKLEQVKNYKQLPLEQSGAINKSDALEYVSAKVKHFNQHYQFDVGRVNVKNNKSLWGSCSKRKNLNFNQRIVFLPEHQADYIIVHELCHLREFNHSHQFWKLVAQTTPNYKTIRKELRNYSFS